MKILCSITALLTAMVMTAAEFPQSIAIKCGNVDLRLDGAKRWNINSVKINGEVFGIDNPGSHYGMTYMPLNAGGFVGSGHTETGEAEIVKSMTFTVDGKIVPVTNKIAAKKSFHMEKISIIKDFDVIYSFSLENNILFERIRITAKNDIKTQVVYCFMHPWSPKFTEFYVLMPNGSTRTATLVSNEKFPISQFHPKMALFNPSTGSAIATTITRERGTSGSRLMWDRKIYHKDYMVLAGRSTIAAGHVMELSAKTVFFKTTADKFTADADKNFMLY